MTATGFPPPFRPSRWLAGAHAQTVLGATLHRGSALAALRRQRIELDDGDFIDVDVAAPRPGATPAGWVLVLHGLAGSSRSPAVRGLAAALVAAGHEVCLMNYRGCSGEPNRLPRAYHGGETDDVLAVLRRLAADRPGRFCGAVGFSIGANMLMRLVGEDAARVPGCLVATVAISPPYDLARCAAFLDRPFRVRSLYRRQLIRALRVRALATLARFPGCVAATSADLRAARTFAAFDGLYTAPLHGFRDAADYWHRASGGRWLARIGRPMLIVSAADDPFYPPDHVPRAAIAANPSLELVLSARGGHCGFVGGPPWAPVSWAERAAVGFLSRHLPGPET
ncbi:MAG: YheT family hydrolase [Planctomycetaceae bacterium]